MLLVLVAHVANDWDDTFVSKTWCGSILGKCIAVAARCVTGVCIVERAGAICLFFRSPSATALGSEGLEAVSPIPCNTDDALETRNWALSLKCFFLGELRVDVGQVHAKSDVLVVATKCRWRNRPHCIGGKLRHPTSAGGC